MNRQLGKRMRTVAATAAIAAAGGLLGAPASHASQETTYGPAFELGPKGGDQYNYVSADPQGRVTAARAYPLLGNVASCTGQAGYAKLQVQHTPVADASSVSVSFTEAAVDPYVFVIAGVRDSAGRWIGATRTRGAVGDGALTMQLEDAAPGPITIQFGLELSGACPSFDAGTLRFTSVKVVED